MDNKNILVPRIRFQEFSGEWEQKKLGEVATFHKGKGISKADISIDGKYSCIRYGELYTKYNEVISEVVSKTNISSDKLVFSKKGDVLIPSSGETQEDIATASCVLEEGIALGGDLNIIRSELHGSFLSYYLNGSKSREIAKFSQGIVVVHLYSKQLEKLKTSFPSLPEQQKIASTLSSLDAIITTHTDKLEALKQHKKALLQQLFPQQGESVPRLRFAGFSGEWESKRFDNLFEIGSGKDYKHLSKGNTPVYGSGGYMLSVDKFLYDGESPCIGRKGTINKPQFLTGKFWTVDTLFYTHSFKRCTPKFIFNIFQNITWNNYNEAGGVPSLSKKVLNKIEVAIPTLPEQQKIADTLSSLDTIIEQQSKKIDLLKQHKKGMMQGLFPQAEKR
ncbi:MAG: restriction endonuclease subunit S [Flavobacteriaceae bacterium]|nr:restriction endonuclease subunit S [Flavobacteriaceae bacterium]